MKLELVRGLPLVSLMLLHHGASLKLDSVLLDTGSAGTIFSADKVAEIGLLFEAGDQIHRISGVGGSEFVFSKCVDQLILGELVVDNFAIEIGEMNYGFQLNGIIGMDFLGQVGAVIDLAKFEIYKIAFYEQFQLKTSP